MDTQLVTSESSEDLTQEQNATSAADTTETRKCPFCEEEIKLEAIKSHNCDEFFRRATQAGSNESAERWGLSNGATVIALLCLGPLALPIVWLNPRYKRATKTIITIAVVAVTVLGIYLIAFFQNRLYENLGLPNT